MEENKVLDTSILIDGRTGLTTVFNIIEYPPAIEKCVILLPERMDFNKAIELASKLRLNGTPVGCIDIMIASMCINRKLKLSTKDKDYRYIKEVHKGFSLEIISSRN